MQIYDWYEIDDIQDLDMASLLFSEPSKSYELTAKGTEVIGDFPMF